jgi:hypothetical protein
MNYSKTNNSIEIIIINLKAFDYRQQCGLGLHFRKELNIDTSKSHRHKLHNME